MATKLNLSVSKVPDSADVLANTSKIRITLTVTTTGESWNANGNTKGYVAVDEAEVASLDGKKFYKNSTTTIYNAEHAVQHEADGTKTVEVSYQFDTHIAAGVVSGEQTLTLDRILRVAFLNVPAMTLGQKVTLHVVNPGQNAYTVRYALGNKSGLIVENSLSDTVEWTPPFELAEEIFAPSGKGKLLVSSVEGEYEYDFTALIPDSLAPQITGFVPVFKADSAAVSQWGVGVKGKTKLGYTVEASGQYGASIASCTVSFGGATGNGLTGETGTLMQVGSFVPKITVTDNRQKTAVLEASALTVYDYTTPAFISSAAYRADEDGNQMQSGTYVAVTAAASYAPVGGYNSATLKARSRVTEGVWGQYTELSAQRVNVLPNFSAAMSYEVEVLAEDALGESRSVVYSIPTEAVTFHLRPGGKGAAFGQYSDREGYVETAWPIDMLGNRVENVGAPQSEADAANKQYVDEHTAVPEMLFNTEYALNEKWNGKQVYAMVVDYGALPNAKEGSNDTLAAGLDIISMIGFAVGDTYVVPVPGYYAIQNMGYTKSTGNLWISTTINMSGYHGYITVKYTK